ncbi:MAG: hypothetical protein QOG48_297 [Verrucomicrobiota bacterium]|jgi:hypothetical protein
MRNLLRALALKLAQTFGARVVNSETGELLGKALIIPWRGKIHIIGLGSVVKPVFQPQKRLAYWKQEIVFIVPPKPDFPNERDSRKIDNR